MHTFEPKAPAATTAVGLGVLTAACIATAAPVGEAKAQSTQLPAVTVEAPAEQRKPKPVRVRQAKPRPAQSARPRVARPAPAAVPAQSAAAGIGGTGGPGSNPNADPAAPYKVNRSASQKLTQPLLDTPRTITTIPKEVISDKGATSFRELMRTTPGVTLGTGEGGNAYGDRVFIRGFDARNDFYVDGVRDAGVNIRENFNTEQVEILKGPAGVIGGRGTSGGAINVVTKQAGFDSFYNISTTVGTDMTRRVTADINQALTDQLAIRGNVMWQKADVAGRDYVHDDRWGGALAATYRPSDSFKLTLSYSHTDIDQLPDWGVPFNSATLRPWTESGLNRNNYYGMPNRDFQKAKQDIASAKAEWNINEFATLTNTTRYSNSLLDYVAGAPGTPVVTNPNPALWTVPSTAKSRYQTEATYANQTDLTLKFATAGVGHTMVIGTEFSREKLMRDTYQSLATEANVPGAIPGTTLNLWNPNPASIPWTGTFIRTGRPTTVTVDTKSVYALDTLNFQEKLFVTGGVRFDRYEIGASSVGANNVITNLGRTDNIFNWNLGVTYKVLPYAAVYAAYGTSSNPTGSELDGGAADYGALTAANATLGPEKNKSYEIGTKWELFDRHLLATAALFRNEKDNARETVGANVQATGAYRVDGVEFSVAGKITDRWSVFGGAVFMKTDVTKSAIAANVGQKLANIAHQSFNILTKYDITDALTLGGGATYISQQYGGTLAANSNILPGGWRFDLLAEYKLTKNVSAKVQVNNVFDKLLYDGFYRSAVPYVYVAPGRVAYFSVNFKY
ncbi:TonB-dependent siderophore receptor [Terrarubrum flagellatum]|uniref:TonB-dependent receptor n=1 Tax=Terrirubrum flagellatum TaxID=2895980 RepID=UPI0031454909